MWSNRTLNSQIDRKEHLGNPIPSHPTALQYAYVLCWLAKLSSDLDLVKVLLPAAVGKDEEVPDWIFQRSPAELKAGVQAAQRKRQQDEVSQALCFLSSSFIMSAAMLVKTSVVLSVCALWHALQLAISSGYYLILIVSIVASTTLYFVLSLSKAWDALISYISARLLSYRCSWPRPCEKGLAEEASPITHFRLYGSSCQKVYIFRGNLAPRRL